MNNKKMIIAGGACALLAGIGFIVLSSDDEIAEVIQEVETEMAQEAAAGTALEEGVVEEVEPVEEKATSHSSGAVSSTLAPTSNAVVLGEINNGNNVTVPFARLLEDGYVVLYRINSKGDVSLMGKSELLKAGTHTDIKIRLANMAVERQAIVAVLHEDDGDGKFEYPGADNYLLNGALLSSDIDVVGIERSDRESKVLETQVEAFLKTNFKE